MMYSTGLDDSFGTHDDSRDGVGVITSPYRQSSRPTLQDLEKEYVKVRRSNANLKFRCLALEERLQSLQRGLPPNVPELQLRLAGAEAELGQLRQDKAAVDEERNRALLACQRLEQRCAELEAHAAGLEAREADLRSSRDQRMHQAEQTIQKLRDELRDSEAQRARLERRSADLVQDLADARARAALVDDADTQRVEAEVRAQQLEGAVQEAARRQGAAERAAAAARDAQRAAEELIRQREGEWAQLEAALRESAGEERRQAEAGAEGAQRRLQEQHAAALAQLRRQGEQDMGEAEQRWQREILELRDELRRCQDAVSLSENRAKRREELVAELHETLPGVERERDELRLRVSELEEQLGQAIEHSRGLEEQLEELQQAREADTQRQLAAFGMQAAAYSDEEEPEEDDDCFAQQPSCGGKQGHGLDGHRPRRLSLTALSAPRVTSPRRGTIAQHDHHRGRNPGVEAATSPIPVAAQRAVGCDPRSPTTPSPPSCRSAPRGAGFAQRLVLRAVSPPPSPAPRRAVSVRSAGISPMSPAGSVMSHSGFRRTVPRGGGTHRPPLTPLKRVASARSLLGALDRRSNAPTQSVRDQRSAVGSPIRSAAAQWETASVRSSPRQQRVDREQERLLEQVALLRSKEQELEELRPLYEELSERCAAAEDALPPLRGELAELRAAAQRILSATYMLGAEGLPSAEASAFPWDQMDTDKTVAALCASARGVAEARRLLAEGAAAAAARAEALGAEAAARAGAARRRLDSAIGTVAGLRRVVGERNRLRTERESLRRALREAEKDSEAQHQRVLRLQEDNMRLEFEQDQLRADAELLRAECASLTREAGGVRGRLSDALEQLQHRQRSGARSESTEAAPPQWGPPSPPDPRPSAPPEELLPAFREVQHAVCRGLSSLREYIDDCGWGKQRSDMGQNWLGSVAACAASCSDILKQMCGAAPSPRGLSPSRPGGRPFRGPSADDLSRAAAEGMVERLATLHTALQTHQEQRESSYRALAAKLAHCEEHLGARLAALAAALAPREASPRAAPGAPLAPAAAAPAPFAEQALLAPRAAGRPGLAGPPAPAPTQPQRGRGGRLESPSRAPPPAQRPAAARACALSALAAEMATAPPPGALRGERWADPQGEPPPRQHRVSPSRPRPRGGLGA